MSDEPMCGASLNLLRGEGFRVVNSESAVDEKQVNVDEALVPLYSFIFRWVVRPALISLVLAVFVILLSAW
ncbi:MAG: hypothetical protein IKZ87_05745 [Actinomycetaceae bacterium]|nr:hypothetical protein [Actinomycetaceae bacterium]